MADAIILAIETSCDETGVAVLRGKGNRLEVLASALASQIDIHKETGGVIPNVAAREHAKVITPLIKKVIRESKISPPGLHPPNWREGEGVDAIAVTIGPGLMPALSVGVTAAKTLAFAWQKPIIPVHHLEGHIYSALVQSAEKIPNNFRIPEDQNTFPALALIVSGGHTQLILVQDHLNYKILGSTRDDAVGEAFDKVARLLGLGYPGGPAISKIAEQGNPEAFKFTRPMLQSGDLDFSFSGLKTEVLYKVRELGITSPSDFPLVRGRAGIPKAGGKQVPPLNKGRLGGVGDERMVIADLAASFQTAAIDSLVAKTLAAISQTKPRLLLLAGGVAANQLLRKNLAAAAQELRLPLQVAPLNLCGDNAIMIGQVGLFAYQQKRHIPPAGKWQATDAVARFSIENFSPHAVSNFK